MRIEQIAIGDATKTVDLLLDPVGGFVQMQRFRIFRAAPADNLFGTAS